MTKKIVVVGGVAGGATAVARLRRLDEKSNIVLFERGEYISFANCGLPYYIGEVIQDRKKLLVQTVEGMSKKFNLDIRNLSEVTEINRENKTVMVHDIKKNSFYEESYDVLILSPGARPIVPPIPGINEANALFTLRNIPDTDRIKSYVDEQLPKEAVVIGGGFIGLEMAENLAHRGIQVTLVEMMDQVLAPLDKEMAILIQRHLEEKGVNVILQDGVSRFEENGQKVILSSGRKLTTNMIILAIGVQPESELAEKAGLELGVRKTIKVNNKLQTSDENIYAIGDAIEVKDYINGESVMIPLAWPANRQGRIVANNIYGKEESYNGTLGTAIVKVFDLTAAVTGANEKTLKRLEKNCGVVHIHPASHAGYYPGAHPISLKLLFCKDTGKIYGAQAVGVDGVDKRIDVLATAIKGGLTVFDLPDLELAYAPPYSSAKDPVNMAGYVASNIVDGFVESVQWYEVDDIVAEGGLLLDVREPVELKLGAIEGSVNFPLSTLRERMSELPKDKEIYVTCQVGLRGYLTSRTLSEHGYKVKNLDGGWKTYSAMKNQGTADVEVDDSGVSRLKSAPSSEIKADKVIELTGLQCPEPATEVIHTLEKLSSGEILEIVTNDLQMIQDIKEKTNDRYTVLCTLQGERGYSTFVTKNK